MTVHQPEVRRVTGRGVAPVPRRHALRGQAVPTVVGALASLLCASSLRPLFDGFFWWFGPVLLAVLAVVGLAALGRRLGLGPAATVVLSLVGLLLTLTVLCARSEAWLGFVPNGASLSHLVDLISSGRQDMSRLAAPVPSRPGLVVLIVLGTSFVALVVDLLVVAAARPTLAGLPLLGLFAVPAAVLPHGVGTGPFTLGVLGFLALLLLDGRTVVHRWGRLVTARGQGRTQLWLGGLAGRVAVVALVIAALAPFALPSLDGHGLVHRTSGPTGNSGPTGTRTTVQWPMVTLQDRLHVNQQQPLLTVRSTGLIDSLRLRTVALEDYDATRQSFNLRELSGNPKAPISSHGLPGPASEVDTHPMTATVSVEPGYGEDFLPAPWIPTSVRGLSSDWLLDKASETIFNPKGSAAGATYTVTSAQPEPTVQQLTARGPVPADVAYDTKLPATLDPKVKTLALQLTGGAKTDYDKVRAIQDWFHTSQFHYDLNGAPTGQDALDEFLFGSKTGYCEQFASAMTLLVRELGIPARVAVGFVDGERRPDGSVLIRGGDAHAWPEVWLPGTGWIAFEPTPRTDGVTVPSYAGGPDQPSTPPDGAGTQQPTSDPTQDQQSSAGGGVDTQSAQGSTAQASGHTLTDLAGTLQGGGLSEPRLSVRTSDPEAFRGVFLRETALDTFTGNGFAEQALPASGDPPLDQRLDGPPAGVTTKKLTATVSVHPDFHESELPVPAGTTSVQGLQGSWQVHPSTGTVYAEPGTTAAGAAYTVEARIPAPTAAQLAKTGTAPAELAPDLALPSDLDPRIRQQAQSVTATATTAYDKAVALDKYLTSAPFTYDVGAPAGTVSDLLFGTHAGFCNHYATAMAVLARTLEIPARVAVGYAYTSDVPQSDGSLLYKAGNWHAWTEIWLPGAGWVTFNPTPDGKLDLGANTWTPDPGQKQLETGGQTGTAASTGLGHRVLPIVFWALIALAGLALLGTPALIRVGLRRRRLHGDPPNRSGTAAARAAPSAAQASARVRAGWAELLDVATDLGIPLRPSDSPRMVIARLDRYLSAGPEADEDRVVAARAALTRLAWAEERVRYAPSGTSVEEAADSVAADVTTAVGALLSVAPRSRRLVAQVAPPSVLRRVTRSGAYGAAERTWRRRPTPPAPPTGAEPEPSEPAAQA
jgi:transglutaminase-like putative cysteine protease